MKWVLRTLVILLAAVLVSGATAWLAPNLVSTRNFPGGGEGRPREFEQRPPQGNEQTDNDDTNNNTSQNRPVRRERGERGGGIFGLAVVFRSLLQITIVVLPFAIYSAIKQRRKKSSSALSSQVSVS